MAGTLQALIIFALPLLTLPALAGPTLVQEPADDDPMGVHIYELDNGLTVYLSQNDERPRFYAEIAVRVGSKHDPDNATGLAHYLEHLMFKGSQQIGTKDWDAEKPLLDQITGLYEDHFAENDAAKRAEIYTNINEVSQAASKFAIPNELTKTLTAMGGNKINAHTSVEETVYKVSMPSTRLEAWAKLEADRFLNPVFRLFHTELEIVYEEKNRSIDNKDRVLQKVMGETLYKAHPYGTRTTLGKIEHLKKPSIRIIEDYYKKWYVANNMAVCISGDIDIEETIAVIDREFSVWPNRPLPELPSTDGGAWTEPAIDGVRRASVNFPGEEQVVLAYRTVPHDHPDYPACTLADMLLDNSVAGLINLNLNQAQQVKNAGSYPWVNNDYGAQYLYGIPKKGQTLDEVETLLRAQLDKLKAGEFDDWLLPAIITDYEKREKKQLEDNESRVSLLRDSFLAFESWNHARSEIDRLKAVTKEQIVAAANTYFGDNYIAVTRVDAEREVVRLDKPQIDPLDIPDSDVSPFAAELIAMPAEAPEPKFLVKGEDYIYRKGKKNGTSFIYVENPFNDLFTLSLSVPTGTRVDPWLGYAARLLDKSGTEDFTGAELKTEWYKLGSDFSLSAGPTDTTLSISGLDEHFDATLALMLDLVQAPVAEDDALENLKTIIATERASQRKDPQALHRALLLYNRYGENSPFLTRPGIEEINAATKADLLDRIPALLTLKGRTLSYVGSLDEKILRKKLSSILKAKDLKPAPERPIFKMEPLEEDRIYVLDQDNAQALIRIEFPAGLYDPDNHVPMELYRNYFGGGMSSVVFQQLREARSLAYSAWAWYFPPSYPDEQNIVAGFIGTQADKTPDALSAFLDLFENLPIAESSFEEIRGNLESEMRTEPIPYSAIPATVQAWNRLGIKKDPRPAEFEEMEEADTETLSGFHAAQIKETAKRLSIVGKIDELKLEKHSAKATSIDEIFVK